MASDCKREVFRNGSSPTFNHSSVWILVEGVVDFYKVEDFRVRLQLRASWNVEIGPAARSDEILRHLLRLWNLVFTSRLISFHGFQLFIFTRLSILLKCRSTDTL